MQLVLNVSDDLFNDTIKDQIKSLKPEDLQEALVGAIGTYFTENKQALERVFFDRSGYGSSDQPSAILRHIMASLDYSELQSVVDDAIKLMHERHETILKELLMEQIVHQLTSTYSFQSALSMAISSELYKRGSQQ